MTDDMYGYPIPFPFFFANDDTMTPHEHRVEQWAKQTWKERRKQLKKQAEAEARTEYNERRRAAGTFGSVKNVQARDIPNTPWAPYNTWYEYAEAQEHRTRE